MALRFTLGLVGRFLIRSWWAVAVAPIVFIVTFWIARGSACPDCSELTYDIGILGAIVYGFMGLILIMLGTALGAVAGRFLEKWLRRLSAD